LEGDCVGLTWPIPQAGLLWARLFFRPQAFIDKPSIDKPSIDKPFIDKSFIDKPYRCAD
jgi:hypothetical protein